MISFSRLSVFVLSLCGFAALVACSTVPQKQEQQKPRFSQVTFADLPGWTSDDLRDARLAMSRSCARFAALPDDRALRYAGMVGAWRPFCAAALTPDGDLRQVIEDHLVPWQVKTPGAEDGLFTGYYEASLTGSATRHGAYQTPIRARPLDHVVVDLGAFKPEWKGQRLTGQLTGEAGAYTLQPYPTRPAIVAGGIPVAADRALAYVDSPVDAFFLEIQGSGRIQMEDGSALHVGFAERNGQAYTALGKVLVDRGALPKDNVSMQSIRAYLEAHPGDAQALMNENASYIFFREIGTEGPLGAEGVPLTPGRSLAVDKDVWSYGVPFFVDAAAPTGEASLPRLQRFMVAQDTGGAIKGIIRGDVFWGFGPQAEQMAGVMKSRGTFWIFLPKGVRPE